MSPPSLDRTLSPRELAAAIGASESSVKRWIDAGRLPASLTSGGHRRLELIPALRFVLETKRRLVDPGLLGLGDPGTAALADESLLAERLHDHLATGRRDRLERDLLAVLSTGLFTPAELFDGPVREALRRIGELWHGGHRGVFVEHRATTALLGALVRVHDLYDVPEDAPVAVGGSVAGDPNQIPTRMVAIVLATLGFRTMDLGADTPGEALVDAAERLDARLVWLSVSYAPSDRRSEEVARLLARLDEMGVPCVLGGRGLPHLELPETSLAWSAGSLGELARRIDPSRRDARG